jgi:hypothetical protein
VTCKLEIGVAIPTEFIDFIVPISTIRSKYPGGWEQCLKDHQHLLDGRVWHDDYLFRDGAMNSYDIKLIAEHWTDMGFTGAMQIAGEAHWVDFCVNESFFSGPTLPCSWLRFGPKSTVSHIDDPYPENVMKLPLRGSRRSSTTLNKD